MVLLQTHKRSISIIISVINESVNQIRLCQVGDKPGSESEKVREIDVVKDRKQ